MSSSTPLSDKGHPAQFFISTFYHFVSIPNPEEFKTELKTKAQALNIKGLIILGHEGFNTTSSCESKENLEAWKDLFKKRFKLEKLNNKDSVSDIAPFLRFSAKVRPEIVTTGRNDLILESTQVGKNHHLTPEEWDRMMKEERENVVVIDTRNWYEYNVGTFKGALNPNIEKFTDFPQYFEKQNIDKTQKIMIFCTGGIRCEKGILELQEKGYENVYQLDGGILKYIEEKPNQEFVGECFVFDNRVAVDQNLKPTTVFKFCPHCGQPGSIKKVCLRCDTDYQICDKCVELQNKKDTCSKNCANQWEARPNQKGNHQYRPHELAAKKLAASVQVTAAAKKPAIKGKVARFVMTNLAADSKPKVLSSARHLED